MSQRNSLEARLITRAAKDMAFRQELVCNPKATLEKELGLALPANIEIQVHEESAKVHHLILPRLVSSQIMELDDSQLEAAVGGRSKTQVICNVGNTCSYLSFCLLGTFQ